MIDFGPLRRGEKTLDELARGLSRKDLEGLVNEMADTMLALIRDAEDADVTFVPEDPEAHDTYAASAEEVDLPWTLGHVIVHSTASSEEATAHSLTLARGVPVKQRSRYEVPWQEATTVEFLRGRIEESRRMQLAMLGAWPDRPHLEQTTAYGRLGTVNAIGIFLGGLAHADSHLGQIANILAQARSRTAA